MPVSHEKSSSRMLSPSLLMIIVLRTVYKDIRLELLSHGLLTDKAAGEYELSCSRRESRQGFAKFSKMFCDSLVMWGLYNTLSEDTKGITIGKYMAELRELCSRHSLPCDSIKMVTSEPVPGPGFQFMSSYVFVYVNLNASPDFSGSGVIT
ncbi:hypothetical protein K457DRAFT_1820895 [Linnemannia elongata AG-77]|uniref:Uncharacterized protein n=1 Tax=Linnemannia elongata AG-77 TaxID=1314771 RepID=A0A197JTQ1_9FUNG|nr:hypothetical protein K457DRAFT_1820895 [Linnemannia elongata AG-77]